MPPTYIARISPSSTRILQGSREFVQADRWRREGETAQPRAEPYSNQAGWSQVAAKELFGNYAFLYIASHIAPAVNIAVKTTLDIADPLLREARKIAARDGTTLRALVEQGLRQIVAARKRPQPFRLRKVTFGGQGLQAEFREAGWDKIRNAIYEDGA